MFTNVFGEKIKKNPNLVEIELLPTQIKTTIECLKFIVENELVPKEVVSWIINPTIKEMEGKINENK